MKTIVIGSEKQNGAVKNTSTDKSAIRPAVPLKENVNQVDPDKEKPNQKRKPPKLHRLKLKNSQRKLQKQLR